MRKRIVPVIVVAVLAIGGYYLWQTYGSGDIVDENALGGTGTIEAEQIAVTPQTTGRVIEAPVEEGAAVKKGDVLYRLDPELLDLTVKQADAGVDAAKANYKHVKADDDSNKAEKAAALAQYDQAKAAAKMARLQLGYATITSPIDGVLSSIAVRAGENAVPGNTLAVVSDTASLTVTIYVPEDRIGDVKLGQAGSLTTDSTDKSYTGSVVFIASDSEFTPSAVETKDQRVKLVYQVKLVVTDADAALKPGMPADVELQ